LSQLIRLQKGFFLVEVIVVVILFDLENIKEKLFIIQI